MTNKENCAGTYYVSGYTTSDGKEVKGYMRTCGAAHSEHSDTMPGDGADEPKTKFEKIKEKILEASRKEELKQKRRADAIYGSDEEYYKKYYNGEFPRYKKLDEESLKRHANDPVISSPIEGDMIIRSPFGWRTHPIFKTVKHHDGIDIKADMNTPVVAAENGTVTKVGINGSMTRGYGKLIEINHGRDANGNEIKTQYAHLNDWNVKKGDIVRKGQVIGKSGSTGGSTGPHLHFNVLKNEKYEDPMDYIGKDNLFDY